MLNDTKIKSIFETRRGILPAPKEEKKATPPPSETDIQQQLLNSPDFIPLLVDQLIIRLRDIQKGEDGIDGVDGETPTDEQLIALIEPLIPEPIKGGDGNTPTEKDILKLLRPLIPKAKNGEDGHTPTDREIRALIKPLIPKPIAGKPGKDGSPDTAPEIAKKLDDHFTGEDQFARMRDLPAKKLYDENKTTKAGRLHRGGGSTGSPIYGYELTGDGNTRVFNVPSHTRAIALIGADFPINYGSSNYSTAGTVLTIAADLPAPTNGAKLTFIYAE